MAVKNETIIKRAMRELETAQQAHNDVAMKKHIANVQLLCDLILDESQEPEQTAEEISQKEMKTMLGSTNHMSRNNEDMLQSLQKPTVAEEKGDSIFDF